MTTIDDKSASAPLAAALQEVQQNLAAAISLAKAASPSLAPQPQPEPPALVAPDLYTADEPPVKIEVGMKLWNNGGDPGENPVTLGRVMGFHGSWVEFDGKGGCLNGNGHFFASRASAAAALQKAGGREKEAEKPNEAERESLTYEKPGPQPASPPPVATDAVEELCLIAERVADWNEDNGIGVDAFREKYPDSDDDEHEHGFRLLHAAIARVRATQAQPVADRLISDRDDPGDSHRQACGRAPF